MNVRRNRELLALDLCQRSDLHTPDPYDVWKTPLGFLVKNLFNRNKTLGFAPAALLTIVDTYFNGRLRLFYRQQEFPIVRAHAALTLLKIYRQTSDRSLLPAVERHLQWLVQHSCTGYSGPCWGLGFKYAVDKSLVYGVNTPLTTMTPYALEAFSIYSQLTGSTAWVATIDGIFHFFDNDVPVLEESDDSMATAYSTLPDRKVINAISYVLFSYSLMQQYVNEDYQASIATKVEKLYTYIVRNQRADGSWYYSPEGNSFIDCFHSCFVIKNLLKSAQHCNLPDVATVAKNGYHFIKTSMYDSNSGLFRRFAESNKPGLIRYDLYDNAEMLNLAVLMHDMNFAHELNKTIMSKFAAADGMFSHIDILGIRHGHNMLRWAVMPYIHALAALEEADSRESPFGQAETGTIASQADT